MIGLEKSRATYAFIPDGNGGLIEADLLLQSANVTKRVARGASYVDADTVERVSICGVAESPMLVVQLIDASDVTIPNMSRPEPVGVQVFSETYLADGASSRSITVPEALKNNFKISIELQASSLADDANLGPEYSESYPPMPLLSPALAIYNQGERYIIRSRGEGKENFTVSLPTPTSPLTLEIRSCEAGSENSVLSINGIERGVLSGIDVSGTWELGNGFLKRYWAGEFKIFEASTINER